MTAPFPSLHSKPRLYNFSACADEAKPPAPPLLGSPSDAGLVRRRDSSRDVRDRVVAADLEFAPYRGRTIWLLHRYFRTSLQIGRLPGILGREFFRSRVSFRKACTFEDEVIFATDLDRCVSRLTEQERQLLAMLVFEEYDRVQVAALTGLGERHVRRLFFQLIDELTRMLLEGGYLHPIVGHEAAENLVKSKKSLRKG